MDSPLRDREQTPEYGVETSDISSQKEVQKSTIGQKVMFTLFWDTQGPISGTTTVISVRYCEIIRDQLKPAIRWKCRGLLSKGVALLHDNGRPHTAAHTVETLRQLNFEVLEHPLSSPDLAPSDFHL